MPEALKLFLSSPGDVPEERALAERVFRRLARQYRERFELTMLVWEHEPLSAHTGFQPQIERPSQCDLLVAILWSRLGTRLPPDFVLVAGEAAPTGTEFEIRDALGARLSAGRPDVWIYRRTTPPRIEATRSDAREQLAQYEALDAFFARHLHDAHGDVLAHHRYDEPCDFERTFTAHLRAWLDRRAGETQAPAQWLDGSPYRGLQVFNAEHRDVYFGRTQAVSDVLQRIRGVEADARAPRMLLVQGMSGIGKSSLLCAGVMPLLEGRAVEGIGAWQQLLAKPSERLADMPAAGPFAVLAERLLQALPAAQPVLTVQALAEGLSDDPTSAIAKLHGYLSQSATLLGTQPAALRVVVCVDQLEECWALSVTMRDAFARCLLALAREGRIWVCATVRSDFVPRMEEAREFAALLDAAQTYTLLPPRPDELVEMIREPATAAGLHWEHAEGVTLDQVVLRDAVACPEGLPLLEFALEQLYEHRRGALLTFDAYRAFGGLAGSIADAAEDSIVAHAGDDAALRAVFRLLVLVEPGGLATRRHALRDAFAREPEVHRMLAALEARRLCTADGARIAFAHEALITAWPRLSAWLATETLLLQAREVLHADAEEWRRRGEPRSLLATAPEKIAEARRLAAAGLDVGGDHGFIEASLRRAGWLRFVRTATVIGIAALAVATSAAAWLAAGQRDEARHARSLALASTGAGALAAGDRDGALRSIDEAESAWRGSDGRADPEVAFGKLRANLVRPIVTEANQHAPMLGWTSRSLDLRRSSLLFLSTAHGDVVVVDPGAGGATLLKNHGSEIVAVAGSTEHEFAVVDDQVHLTRYDGRSGERKARLDNALPTGRVAVACDGDGCDALGWNDALQRCELVRVTAGSTSWDVRRWALQPVAGVRIGMDTKGQCAWNDVQRQHAHGVVAIDHSRRAWAIDASQDSTAVVRVLGTDVTRAMVLDQKSTVLQRPTVLERVDVASGSAVPLSANAALVATLGVSVPGGMVTSVSRDGVVELLRDGRSYSLGRTDSMPLRVFEFDGTRAVLEVNASALVRMVDYRSGRELYRWRAAPSPLRGAFFSAADHRLSVLTSAGELHVWDVAGLEATPVGAVVPPASVAVRRSTVAPRKPVALQPAAATATWAPDVNVQHVLADADADMALLVTQEEGLLFHRGRQFRMAGIRPTISTSVGARVWLVSDGNGIWRISANTNSAPEVDALWQTVGDDRVIRIVPLEGGGMALVLKASIVLLDSDGVERGRTRRDSIDALFATDLVRAHANGDVLVLESAGCELRRVHVPTGRLLHAVFRHCEEAR